MNAQMLHTEAYQEGSPLKLIKSDFKVLNVHYLGGVNLITAVGWSISDDIWIKYYQILADIESHLIQKDDLTVYFKFELLNAFSAEYLIKIINRMNQAHADGKNMKICWSCGSGNLSGTLELGLNLEKMCDFEFQISYV